MQITRRLRLSAAGRALWAACWIACVATAAGLVLLFWPERLGLKATLGACAAASALASAAALSLGAGKRARMVFAAVILTSAAVFAGALGWRFRDRLERTPSLWSALDLQLPELEAVRSALARDDESACEAVMAHFRRRPPLDVRTLPPISDEEEREMSELILSSTFKFSEFTPVQLPRKLAWNEQPFKDRIWQWTLHTMPFVPALAARFARTQDARFLAKAEELVCDWIDDNQLYLSQPPSPFSWHDHVMALRVRGWLPFWEEWIRSPLASGKHARKILEGIIFHAERLADPRFYNKGHNHGMEQDFALLAISVTFPELKKSAEWRKLATRRLGEQVAEVISPAGVQMEHSPYYHVFTLGILSDAQEFARRMGVTEAELNIDPTLRKMARYTADILQPDGTLPLIGDTPREGPLTPEHLTLSRFMAADPVLRFALTRGREGAPGEKTIFFKDEGYAVFRDAWKPAPEFDQTVYLFFTAAAHRGRVHKQYDDLSFTLFARGLDILTDPGFHSNEYGDPEREYVTGTSAHNCVLVDGKGFMGWTGKIDATLMGEEYALVQGSHSNYPDVTHRRTLFFVRPSTVFVIDELRPGGVKAGEAPPAGSVVHDFEQLFHFGPALSAVSQDGGSGAVVDVGLPGEKSPLLRIEQLGCGRASCEVIRGSREPFQGWVATGYRTLAPAAVASFKDRGAEAVFVTLIEALPPSAPSGSELVRANPSCSHKPKEGVILLEWLSEKGPRKATLRLEYPVEVRL